MTTNKKKSKRGERKPKPTPSLSERELEMLKMARFEQANVLRSRLSTNLGGAFSEVRLLLEHLDTWVSEGNEITGAERLPSLERNLEWHFHPKIDKYPEVWVRGNDNYGC
jgi:hypothetical protein